MNVEREIRDADRRIQKQIDVSARAALVRIGVDVDAMERAERERQAQEAREVFAAFGAALGSAFATLVDFSIAYVEAVASAVEEASR